MKSESVFADRAISHNVRRFLAIAEGLDYARHMPPRVRWIVAVLLYSVGALAFFPGCVRRSPELIAVSRVAPDRVQERDVVTISGDGFVVGVEALVRFSGTSFRPGAVPQRVNAQATGIAVDSKNVELTATSELLAAIGGGTAEGDSHATFRGSIRVSFVPRLAGAPPIEGQSKELALDVFTQQASGIRSNPGTLVKQSPILEFLGMTVEELGEGGLSVLNVAPAKPAHGAGLLPGDKIRTWGNVRVHRSSDLEPYPGQRLVDVELARDNVAGTFPLLVPVEGYILPSAHGWWGGLVIIGLLIVPLFVSRSALSRWMVWLAVAGARRNPWSKAAPVRRALAIGPFLVVSLVFLAIAAQRRIVPGELDLVWIVLAVSLTVALSATSAARNGQRFSFLSFLSLLVRQLPLHLALWGCTIVTILEQGRASVWELAGAQSLDPRTYGAFASPSSFSVAIVMAFTSVLLALCPYAGSPRETAFWRRADDVSSALGDVACLMLVALLVAMFFGGWSFEFEPPSSLGIGGALSFQLKFTACYVAFVFLRLTVPKVPVDSLEHFGLRALVPLTAVALVALPVWSADIWPNWVRSGVQTLLLSVTLVFLVGVPPLWVAVRRVAASRLRVSGINPWI